MRKPRDRNLCIRPPFKNWLLWPRDPEIARERRNRHPPRRTSIRSEVVASFQGTWRRDFQLTNTGIRPGTDLPNSTKDRFGLLPEPAFAPPMCRATAGRLASDAYDGLMQDFVGRTIQYSGGKVGESRHVAT